jgi:hypothetical protein
MIHYTTEIDRSGRKQPSIRITKDQLVKMVIEMHSERDKYEVDSNSWIKIDTQLQLFKSMLERLDRA